MSEDNKDKPGSNEEVELNADDVRHPETLYDRSDLSARGVMMFFVGLAFTIVVIHLITWGVFRYFSLNRLTTPPRSAAIVTPSTELGKRGEPVLNFPAPQLQPDPVADMNKFRAAEEEQLNSYGWIDQKSGIMHIPIDRAIDMVSHSGLPTRPQPALPPLAGFGSGNDTPAGAGGGTEPRGNK